MFFRQIIHEDLGCASYLIADRGEAVIVDPRWDIDVYLAAAAEAHAAIVHVLETHFHADHVSGRVRLAQATGAATHLPRDPAQPDRGGLVEGAVIEIGDVEIRAIAAPGHRPEHLAFLVTDRGAAAGAARLLAGDSLLVGELARPDLAVDATTGAEALFDTARRLVALGEQVELWPAHVGGSLCGAGNLSDETSSTIGRELVRNRLLGIDEPAEFVTEITRTIPSRPPRVASVVARNIRGARSPGPVPELDPADLAPFVAAGVCLLDVRAPEAFDAAHVPGSVNLPVAAKGMGTRAGWVTSEEEPLILIVPSPAIGAQVGERLLAAGVWNLAGMSVADPGAWARAGLAIAAAGALEPDEVVPRLLAEDLDLIDVRDAAEWRTGHLLGSLHLPLSILRDGRDCGELIPREREIAVACARGPRAAVAASVLRRRGHAGVCRVIGGIGDLADRGLPLVAGP